VFPVDECTPLLRDWIGRGGEFGDCLL
jgi:hypothetical protein